MSGMAYNDIISSVSHDLGLSESFVSKVYRAFWRAVREHIESLPLMEDLSDEQFMALQPNVNIPSIGKLHVTLRRYQGVKKHYNYYKEYLDKQQKQDNNVKD